MKKRILIIQNDDAERPGKFLKILKRSEFEIHIIDLYAGEEFPDPENYSGVIILGGPDSANDVNDKMRKQIKRIKEIISKDIPFLGICLGMQCLAKAIGCDVIKAEPKEIGFRDLNSNPFVIELNEDGKNDPLFSGMSSVMRIFHFHGETIVRNGRVRLLATGVLHENQAIKVGAYAYGIQGHLELDKDMLTLWHDNFEILQRIGLESLAYDYGDIEKEYNSNSERLLNNFLGIVRNI